MNFLATTLVAANHDGAVVRLADGSEIATAIDADGAPGTPLTLGIRPEHVAIGGRENAVTAPVALVESLGSRHFAYLDMAGEDEPLIVALPERRPATGSLAVSLPRGHLHLFAADGAALPAIARSQAA